MSMNQSFRQKRNWSRIRDGNFLFIFTAGLLVLLLLAYLAFTYKSGNSSIHFSPSDVIYGVPLQAEHTMGQAIDFVDGYPTQAGKNGHPILEISERFYDFGTINPNSVATRTFVIANRGDAPLVIAKAYTTCGCTIADISAQEIPPGKVALMTLKFDPAFHHQHGVTVRRGVIIQTNDDKNPSTEVWIQASIP
jgi:hypothetical protein